MCMCVCVCVCVLRYCYEQSEMDSKNNIEAAWQEESHLNKYSVIKVTFHGSLISYVIVCVSWV